MSDFLPTQSLLNPPAALMFQLRWPNFCRDITRTVVGNSDDFFQTFLDSNMWLQGKTRLETAFLTLFARMGLVTAGVGVESSKFIRSSTMTQVTTVEEIIALAFTEQKF